MAHSGIVEPPCSSTSISGDFSPRSFDVHPLTGFFPAVPLPRLSKNFEHWEVALDAARECVTLGIDNSPEAMERKAKGEVWRESIRHVCHFKNMFQRQVLIEFLE